MTDEEMIAYNGRAIEKNPVHVKANDYRYDGWLVSAFSKRSGQWRCVVEDDDGRLFIHNAGQITAL
jgi:hypothetical protein